MSLTVINKPDRPARPPVMEARQHGYQTIDRDRLYMAKRDEAVRVATLALDGLQRETPELMVAGLAVLFATIQKRVGLDAHDLYVFGSRLLEDQEHHYKANMALQSLRDFAGIRIDGRREVSTM